MNISPVQFLQKANVYVRDGIVLKFRLSTKVASEIGLGIHHKVGTEEMITVDEFDYIKSLDGVIIEKTHETIEFFNWSGKMDLFEVSGHQRKRGDRPRIKQITGLLQDTQFTDKEKVFRELGELFTDKGVPLAQGPSKGGTNEAPKSPRPPAHREGTIYQIWSASNNGVVIRHGESPGSSFQDACNNFALRSVEFLDNYDPTELTCWSGKLYDSEAAAKEGK